MAGVPSTDVSRDAIMYSTLTATATVTRDGSAVDGAMDGAMDASAQNFQAANAKVFHSGSNSVSDFVEAANQTHGAAYGETSFGSSTGRFEAQNKEIRKQSKLPGPTNYYSFGAGNFSPGQRMPNNHIFNDSRALDGQWNNRSHSTKYGQ